MEIGIITGSGTYALPGFAGEAEPVRTPWGEARVSRGTFAGIDVAHVSRHGAGHVAALQPRDAPGEPRGAGAARRRTRCSR